MGLPSTNEDRCACYIQIRLHSTDCNITQCTQSCRCCAAFLALNLERQGTHKAVNPHAAQQPKTQFSSNFLTVLSKALGRTECKCIKSAHFWRSEEVGSKIIIKEASSSYLLLEQFSRPT